MKMKYYLRGLGVGFIISSLIFMICFSFHETKLTDKEFKKEAERLGYTVDKIDDGTIKSNSDSKKKKETKKNSKEKTDSSKKETKKTETEEKKPLDDTVNNPDGNNETTVTTENIPANSKDPESGPKTDEVHIEVLGGMNSWTVAKSLADNGVISNAEEFDKYLVSNNYANRIHPGSYTFTKNSDFSQIAKNLTGSN